MISPDLWFKIGCLSCSAGVVLATIGGHKEFEKPKQGQFDKAKFYHFINSLGIIISSMKTKSMIPPSLFAIGILGFSGSLYMRVLTKHEKFGFPPIGGVAMIIGWVALAFSI